MESNLLTGQYDRFTSFTVGIKHANVNCKPRNRSSKFSMHNLVLYGANAAQYEYFYIWITNSLWKIHY